MGIDIMSAPGTSEETPCPKPGASPQNGMPPAPPAPMGHQAYGSYHPQARQPQYPVAPAPMYRQAPPAGYQQGYQRPAMYQPQHGYGHPQMMMIHDGMPGLCACCTPGFHGDHPIYNFCRAYVTPCIPALELQAVADPSTEGSVMCQALWCCCSNYMSCYHGLCTTPKLRQKFGLVDSTNCCAMCWCTPCAMEQYHKFLRIKLQKDRWGQHAMKADRQGPGPSRQRMF